jgi:hypothetical protein
MQFQCMLDISDILEMNSVRDLQALHSISMSPLLEMSLKGSSSPVRSSSTDLALKLQPQSVKLVQPVGNWLTIPAHWQVLWIILGLVVIILIV